MKRDHIITKILAGLLIPAAMLAAVSCQNLLEETPRSQIMTDLFETAEGMDFAMIGVYSTLRNFYGNMNFFMDQELGTDEAAMGQNQYILVEEVNITPSNNSSNAWWNATAFSAINTCNGIIERGPALGVNAKLLGEARVIRALYYFNLVQTSGPAPLDLGSGKLVYNEKFTDTSVRNSVPEVYEVIFDDLDQAIIDLEGTSYAAPARDRGITKTFAQYLSSKANLTYGWWLRNNNQSGEAAYFQKAYNEATAAINNPAGFGLMQYYWDVNEASQDRNMETLFYADRDYTRVPSTQGTASAFLCIRWQHDQAVLVRGATPVYRGNTQTTGRPWYRAAPTYEVTNEIFNDKEHDSRYYGTFQEAWVYTGEPQGSAVETFDANGTRTGTGVNSVGDGAPYQIGDTVWYMPGITPPELVGAAGDAAVQQISTTIGGPALPYQVIPGKKYAIFDLQHYTSYHFPTLWKLGPYRPDYPNSRIGENDYSNRPSPIARFSELYLLAAEAHVMGANPSGGMTATALMNVLRTRAAAHKNYSGVVKTPEQVAASVAFLTAKTPANPDIYDILDERMRELYGEGMRWYDLVRTRKWGELATRYTMRKWDGWTGKTLPPKLVHTRTRLESVDGANSYLYLRPIPQSAIDALNLSDEEKRAYQNPGYN